MNLRNTRIANVLNICALTLPTSQPSYGVSIIALPNMEGKLLRIDRAAELAVRN